MNLEELRQHKPEIERISKENGIANIRVFGSVARGDATPESDVDLLVTVLPGAGWGYFGFAVDMEALLGHRVDVVSDRALKPDFRKRIIHDAVTLFDES